MEKILKIIKKITLLIPFLIISFSMKNVYADDLSFDVYNKYYNDFNSSVNDSDLQYYTLISSYYFEPTTYSFNFYYKNNLIIDNKNYIFNNLFIYRDKSVNTSDGGAYIIFYVYFDSDISNKSVYINKCNNNNSKYCFFYKENNELVESNYKIPIMFLSKGNFAIRNYIRSVYNTSTGWPATRYNVEDTSSPLYASVTYSFWSSTWYIPGGYDLKAIDYILNNSDNFEFITIYKDDLYIDNVKQTPLLSPIIPEPEKPEEPTSPTLPPYNFINNKYYVPNYKKGNCVEIIDKDTIRVFENENSIDYIDYYINSHYVSKTGQVEVNYVKNCSSLDFTDIRYYGNDFPEILFITICILIFTLGFPYILYKRFRKR